MNRFLHRCLAPNNERAGYSVVLESVFGNLEDFKWIADGLLFAERSSLGRVFGIYYQGCCRWRLPQC